jgi:hypothetical protein
MFPNPIPNSTTTSPSSEETKRVISFSTAFDVPKRAPVDLICLGYK